MVVYHGPVNGRLRSIDLFVLAAASRAFNFGTAGVDLLLVISGLVIASVSTGRLHPIASRKVFTL